MFLDSLSCPWISYDTRKKLLEGYLNVFENASSISSPPEKELMLRKLKKVYWFIKWKDLDLIKLLERKELYNAY